MYFVYYGGIHKIKCQFTGKLMYIFVIQISRCIVSSCVGKCGHVLCWCVNQNIYCFVTTVTLADGMDQVMSCHVISHHVMSYHVMSCRVMSCHVMSCHVMSCHVMYRFMSCHVTQS